MKNHYWIKESTKPVWKVINTTKKGIDIVRICDTEYAAERFIKKTLREDKEEGIESEWI